MTPFQTLYDKPPRAIQTYIPRSSYLEAIDIELLTKEDILIQLKQNLLKAQKKIKFQADQNRRELSFQVENLVMVKL